MASKRGTKEYISRREDRQADWMPMATRPTTTVDMLAGVLALVLLAFGAMAVYICCGGI